MTKYFILGYIFFISWNGVFAINEWLRVPVYFLLPALFFALFFSVRSGRFVISSFRIEDLLILLFLLIYYLSALVNMNPSGFNYVLAYFFVFFAQYLMIKFILFSFTTPRQFYAINTAAIIFICVFLVTNQALLFFDVIDLQNSLPRLSKDATATYNTAYNSFVRGYAFSTEPGVVAFYLNILGPIALWYFWNKTGFSITVKTVIILMTIFGWLLTFSAAGAAFLVIGYLLATFLLNFRLININFRVNKKVITRISFFSIFFVVIFFYQGTQVFLKPMVAKLTLTDNLKTTSHRIERIEEGFKLALDKPLLGYGPRYFTSAGESSTLNWYLMLLVESGWVSFFMMIAFLISVLFRMLKSSLPNRFPYLVGFFAGSLHLGVISTFYHPFLWLLIAMFYVDEIKSNSLKS